MPALVSVEALARRLRDAHRSGPVPPLRDGLEPGDDAGAYAVQQCNTAFWRAAGRQPTGHKIGLTAKAVQAQLGVDQPDYGVLFDDMEITDGGRLEPSRAIHPKAEAEVALILKADIHGTTVTRGEVAAATGCAVAAIEIVDSRISDWKISLADTIADNGSAAFFVLGSDRKSLDGLDLYTCGMAMELNGEIVSTGAGASCLGHPLEAAAWLARTVPLRAGDVVLTGALGPMVALTPGDKVVARIGGLGSVSFDYADG